MNCSNSHRGQFKSAPDSFGSPTTKIGKLLKAGLFALGVAFTCTSAVVQASPFPNPSFVGPFNSDYLPPGQVGHYAGQYHSWGNGAYLLSNPVHSNFVGLGSPPPPSVPGACTQHSFGSTVAGNFGLPVFGFGSTLVEVCFNHQTGNDRFFDTEMLQLDISGGSLPGTVLIREDSTMASTGLLAIRDIGGGQYMIASFFDVFTELSLNGGQNWIRSDGSTRMTLVPEPGSLALVGLALAALAGLAGRAARGASARAA